MDGPADLRRALLQYSDAFIRNFIQNLMAYALGRRIGYRDMPAVRKIARDAGAEGNRMSALITGVIDSPAFRMSRMDTVDATGEPR